MKKFYPILTGIVALFAANAANAQYGITQTMGTYAPYVYNIGYTAGSVVSPENMDDELIGPYSLPFSWNFYGKPVTQYKISNNGYITFDVDETESVAANTILPNEDAPKNAIFAFWDDFKVVKRTQATTIRRATYGSAPNRVHIVQWFAVMNKASSDQSDNNLFVFTIRIYEGADFDVVLDIAGTGAGITTGTIGAQNEDGTQGVQVTGSPNINFPSTWIEQETDVVYSFYNVNNTGYDVKVMSLDEFATVKQGTSRQVSGKLQNLKATTITSLEFAYQIDNGPQVKATATGLNIQPMEVFEFTHPTSINFDQPGPANVKLTVTQINGNPDARPQDNSLNFNTIVFVGSDEPLNVLAEYFTGAWCGWCPDGALRMSQIKASYPDAIIVAIHSGAGADAMKFTEATTLTSAFLTLGHPSGMFNRHFYKSEGTSAINRGLWENAYADMRHFEYVPVRVDITHAFDATANRIKGTVTTTVTDHLPANWDLRVNLYIIDDEVTGSGTGWDQVNYYHGNFPSHHYGNAGNPIRNYVHKNVARSMPTGTWGVADKITNREIGGVNNYEFNVPIGTEWNSNNLRVVAYITRVNMANHKEDMVLNSKTLHFSETTTGMQETTSAGSIKLYPNPAQDQLFMNLDMQAAAQASVSILDLNGRTIMQRNLGTAMAGNSLHTFDISGLSAGMYLVQLQTNQGLATQKLIISR